MFSADHPYQSMAQARAFLEQLPVSASDKDRIAHGNLPFFFAAREAGRWKVASAVGGLP
jgi:hypothetical protein